MVRQVACCPPCWNVSAPSGPRSSRPVANLLHPARRQPRRRHARRHPRRGAGALAFFPQGELLDRRPRDHRLRVQRPDRRLDGPHDRARPSTFGAFLDSTLDRIGDGAIFGGLALYFAGPGDSELYLVPVAVLPGDGRRHVLRPGARPRRSGFDAKVGIAERADRLVAILVMTGFSAHLRPADPDRGRALGARGRQHLHGRPADPGWYAARRTPRRAPPAVDLTGSSRCGTGDAPRRTHRPHG